MIMELMQKSELEETLIGIDLTVDKGELIVRILEVIGTVDIFSKVYNFYLKDLVEAKDFTRLAMLQEGANDVSVSKETKKQFITYGNKLS